MSNLYVLYSDKFERFYIGISDDIASRLRRHNLGKVKSTKSFLPWRVIYTEVFINKQEVRKREKYLKSAAGRKWGAVNIDKGD
jgi:putative endonuclease